MAQNKDQGWGAVGDEDHGRRGALPAPPGDQGADRQLAGRAPDPRLDGRRHHRLGRGRRLPVGREGDRRGADVPHDRHRPEAGPRRRGPDGDRPPLDQDVRGDPLLRPRGCGDPGDGRDRPGALGHQGQGAQDAGLAGDRRQVPRPPARLLLQHDAVHARGHGRPGEEGEGRRLHRRQVRLGAVRPLRPWPRPPLPRRDAQGRRAGLRPDARRRPGLGRDDHDPARQGVRALRPVLDRGAAATPTTSRATASSPTASRSASPPARRSARSAASSA